MRILHEYRGRSFWLWGQRGFQKIDTIIIKTLHGWLKLHDYGELDYCSSRVKLSWVIISSFNSTISLPTSGFGLTNFQISGWNALHCYLKPVTAFPTLHYNLISFYLNIHIWPIISNLFLLGKSCALHWQGNRHRHCQGCDDVTRQYISRHWANTGKMLELWVRTAPVEMEHMNRNTSSVFSRIISFTSAIWAQGNPVTLQCMFFFFSFSRQGMLLNLELTDSAILEGQQLPGILPSFSWGIGVQAPLDLVVDIVFWGYELRASCLIVLQSQKVFLFSMLLVIKWFLGRVWKY